MARSEVNSERLSPVLRSVLISLGGLIDKSSARWPRNRFKRTDNQYAGTLTAPRCRRNRRN